MQEEIDTIEAVSRAVDRIERRGKTANFTLVNGIVLKLKPVAPYLLVAVEREFPDPEPPVTWIDEKERNEPNPNHPDHVKALEQNTWKKDLALNNLVLGVGTEFVSAPRGYYGPEEDEWLKVLEVAASITEKPLLFKKDDPTARYIAWLRFYALQSQVDITVVTTLTYQLTGIAEGEVDEILEAFQGGKGRGTDSNDSPPPRSENGNKPNRAARRSSPRNRGT